MGAKKFSKLLFLTILIVHIVTQTNGFPQDQNVILEFELTREYDALMRTNIDFDDLNFVHNLYTKHMAVKENILRKFNDKLIFADENMKDKEIKKFASELEKDFSKISELLNEAYHREQERKKQIIEMEQNEQLLARERKFAKKKREIENEISDENDWGLFSPDGPQLVGQNVNIYLSAPLYSANCYELNDFAKLYHDETFHKDLPTVIYIHGWFGTGERHDSAVAIRSAYRERNDHNIITLDWGHYSDSILYKSIVIPQLKIICESIASNLLKFLDEGYDVEKLHLTGHSLGGQCIGLVSRHLKELSDNRYIIPRLIALDPAAPAFEESNTGTFWYSWLTFQSINFDMISSNDAKFVQIIHTNAGSYGIEDSRGHVDFYPNSGADQTGCELELLGTRNICSHTRAWEFYQESVKNPEAFLAVKCDSSEAFINGFCEGNERAYMGFSTDSKVRGNFYLVTHSNPFGFSLGAEGINGRRLFESDELNKSAFF